MKFRVKRVCKIKPRIKFIWDLLDGSGVVIGRVVVQVPKHSYLVFPSQAACQVEFPVLVEFPPKTPKIVSVQAGRVF